MGYYAETSAEKAKALRLEKQKKVIITRQRDSRVLTMKNGKTRLQGREIFYVEEAKVVKNLMSGKEIVIAKDTPRACDPSSELYWSM